MLVLDRGGTAGELGLVLAARFVAIVLFALLGGVWADRLPRIRVLLSADVLRLVAVLGLVVTSGLTTPTWVLALLVFVVGAGEAFFRPAYGALLPTVLPVDLLPQGNALSQTSNRLAQVLGPGVGGILVAAAGAQAGFVVNAVTFAVSALTLLKVSEPPYEPGPRARLLREVRDGFAAVLARRWIAVCLAMFTFNMLVVLAPVQVLLPVVVKESTGETATYGLVLAAGALGGLAGAYLASRWPRVDVGRPAVLSLALFALEPLGLLLEVPVPVLAVLWAITGIAVGFFIVHWETALQVDVPRELLARVISLDWLATFALFPLGLALVGPLSEVVGRDAVLWTSIAAAVVPPFLVLGVPGVRAFRTPATASASG